MEQVCHLLVVLEELQAAALQGSLEDDAGPADAEDAQDDDGQ